jgi:hypothetical protein
MSPFLTRIPFNKGLGSRISVSAAAAAAPSATLVYDLDAATYTGLSASFNGTSQYLSASNAAFTFTGDFTVEGWYRPTSVSGLRTLFTIGAPTAATGAMVVYSSNGTLNAQPYGGGNISFSGATMSINTWYHIALVRSGSTIKLYLNGTAHATTITNSNSIGNDAFTVGFLSGGYGYFAGQISTVRVTASVVYTGNFTTPTSALALTQSSGTNISDITAGQTKLLLPLNATPFTDSSTNALTVTNTGTVVPGVQYPFAVKDVTNTYTMSITNAGSISWSSTNSGSFAKSNNVGTDVIYGGPDYVTGQSYTVFMAYKLSATSAGRLLNTQSEASKDWLMGAYNGNPSTFYPNFTVNLPSSGADTVWHLDWATWNTSTSTGTLYTSTSTAPTNFAYQATNAGGGGFNQLRMFSRSSGSEVQSGNIAFVKVYNGVLTLSEIQALHATYKTRFGY